MEQAPEPVIDRPVGAIDRLDGAFAVLRQRARVIVSVVTVLVLPSSIVQAWVTRDDLGGVSMFDMLNDPAVAEEFSQPAAVYDAGFFLSQILSLLVMAVAGVAVARVINGWHEGEDIGAVAALRFTAGRAGAVLGAFVAIHVLEAVGMILVLPGLAAVILFSLTSPVLAVEGLGPIASMRRSSELVRRRFGATLGIIMLVGLVAYAVSQAVSTLPSLVALFIGFDRAWPLLAVSNLLVSIVIVPVTAAAMSLTYYDIRYRTEGLDLRQRMEAEWPR